jgi:hypothetical protein
MPSNEEIVREACETIRCGPAFAAALDALVAEGDEQFAADNDRIHLLCEQREAAEAEVARLRHACDYAIHELGVPQDELTPAPVANAYRVLAAALAAPSATGGDAPDGFYTAAKEDA